MPRHRLSDVPVRERNVRLTKFDLGHNLLAGMVSDGTGVFAHGSRCRRARRPLALRQTREALF